MIHLYSGTPGSGKSFHATSRIFYRLRNHGRVIANYPINEDNCAYSLIGFWLKKLFPKFSPRKKKLGQFTYVDNATLTVDFLKKYAKKNHKKGKEHQTLVVIDECGIMFNPRTFTQADRLGWIQFFSLHRHYGYDFILISQSDRMVDRQIRSFFEYDHKHRNVGNFKLFGKILALLCGGSLFIDVTVFYSLREKVNGEWFRYSRRIASLYDSYMLYDEEDEEEEQDDTECGTAGADNDGDTATECGGDPPLAVPDAPLADAPSSAPSILDNSNT